MNITDGLSVYNTDIQAIYESPVNNDIFVLFVNRPIFSGDIKTTIIETYKIVDEDGNDVLDENGNPKIETKESTKSEWTYGSISQLIHVKGDGSYVELLRENQSIYIPSGSWNTSEPVRFDENGNMFFVAYEYVSNAYSSAVFKYNVVSENLKQLTASVKGVQYNSLQLSKDGTWIFVEGYNWIGESSVNFLRAIPVANPDSLNNLFYKTGNSDEYFYGWYYSDKAKTIYYSGSQNDKNGTSKSGIWKNTMKNGKFDVANRELVISDGNSSEMYWSKDVRKADGTVDAEKVYKYIEEKAIYVYSNFDSGSSVDDEKWEAFRSSWSDAFKEIGYCYQGVWKEDDFDENGVFLADEVAEFLKKKILKSKSSYWAGNDYVYYTTDDFEIRFDIFKDVEGFEKLASATQNTDGTYKADGEALQAIYDANLAGLLYDLYNLNRYNYYETVAFTGYKHSLYNDIFYWKNGNTYDIFPENSYSDSSLFHYVVDSGEWYDKYELNSKYTAQDLLDLLCGLCGKEKEVEFKLSKFKDIRDEFAYLYSEKTDLDAMNWIMSDEYRLSIFYRFVNYYVASSLRYEDKHGLEYLCFIKGTDTPAYKLNQNNGSETSLTLADYGFEISFEAFKDIEELTQLAEITKNADGTYKKGKEAVEAWVNNPDAGMIAAQCYNSKRYSYNSIDEKYEHSFLSDIIVSASDGSHPVSVSYYGGIELIWNLFQWDNPSKTLSQNNIRYYWERVKGFFEMADGSLWCAIEGYSNNKDVTKIMKLFDENNELCIEIPESLNELTPLAFKYIDNTVYIINNIISTGTSSGSQNIYSFDGTNLRNLFESVPSGGNIEVVDYSVGDEYLYFTGALGANCITARIKRADGKYEALSVGQELSHIFTIR